MRRGLSEFEQQELLHELSELLATRGWKRFVSWPAVEPTPAFFPERWTADSAGVAVVLRRFLHYANIDLPAEVVLYDRSSSLYHPNVAAWFAGIAEGVCRFGVDMRHLNDPTALAATLAHEVAHAYRTLHCLTTDDREHEEQLTDLTAIYLGFGLLTANAADRYRQSGRNEGAVAITEWSVSSLGYLTADAQCFALAVRAVCLRDAKAAARATARHLEPNPRKLFELYFEDLRYRFGDVRELLDLHVDTFPPMRTVEEFARLTNDAVKIDVSHDLAAERTARSNEGRPVFRVADGAVAYYFVILYAGIALGALVGGLSMIFIDSVWMIPICIAIAIGFLLTRKRSARDVCSGPGCGVRTAEDSQSCESCGGMFVGRISSRRRHYDAEEEWTARSVATNA